MNKIYLDYAATTPTNTDVVAAMHPYFSDIFGNPSSIHQFGQATKLAVEKAREKVAALLNAAPEEIVFTSGGTESDNFALVGIAHANVKKGNHIITSKIEHHAVIETCEHLQKEGFEITYLSVDKFGRVNPSDLKNAITEKTILVSIMHANNEIGTIEPIEGIAETIRQRTPRLRSGQAKDEGQTIYFHTDAVQTAGHIKTDVKELGVDLLSLSAHKFYGPKGIGALYIKKGTRISPLIFGGAQEKNRRAGTENVPGIVGLGKAAELALSNMGSESKNTIRLRDKLINGILNKIPDSFLNGDSKNRLPNNVNVSIKYVEGESMLLNLDLKGIAASTGSACSSGSLEPSHVLMSLGLPHEYAHGSLRFSLGRLTKEEEIDYVLAELPLIVEKLRKMSPLYKGGS